MVDSIPPSHPDRSGQVHGYKPQYHWNKKSMEFAHKLLGPTATPDDCEKFLDNLAKSMSDWINHQQSQYESWRQDMIDQGLLPNPNDAG